VDNFKFKKEEEGSWCEEFKKADSNYSEEETLKQIKRLFSQ